MEKKLIKVDRNGTKYFLIDKPCDRCGGAGGADQWAYTGWTCYKCGGTGQGKSEIIKEYTPEYEAKLEERRAKRRAKWEAEHADEIAEAKAKAEAEAEAKRKAEEEAEKARQAEEARIKAEKAVSQHIGKKGDKLDMIVTFEKIAWFEVPSFKGWGTDTMYVYTFKDADGNKLVWKTTSNLGKWNDDGEWIHPDEGQQVQLKGTVKNHTEYQDEKQTELTRCRVKF